MSEFIETIDARVCGIPCLIGIESYQHQAPDYRSRDSDWDYYGWTESEWSVLDRRGRHARWLERKLTQKDRDEIEGLIDAHFAEQRRQDRFEMEICRAMDRYDAARGL